MNSRILLLPVIGATTFFILLFGFTKIFGPIPFSVNSVTTQKSTTFDVIGEGKVFVIPDVASVTVGIRSQGSTVKIAQDQINSVINKVSDASKTLGIDKKDIQTTGYSIYPDYDYSGSSQRIKGYTASTSLSVKVRDIDKANSVIDAATNNGANEVSGISFEADDEQSSRTPSTKTKAENEAREKAVEDAKKKAEGAAKIAGFKLGRIINYSENLGGFPKPMPLAMGAGIKAQGSPTQVEPGSSEITVTVTLSFEIQ